MKTIKIIEILNKNLALRENARSLFKFVKEKKIDTIDFIDIEFVSRSFANELLSLENNNNITIKKINLSDDSSKMFKYALEESPKRKLNASSFRIGNVDEILSSIV